MKELENNRNVLVKIGRGSTSGCGGAGGCVQREGTNEKGQQVVDVRIDMGGVVSDYLVQQNYGGADVYTVLAHEIHGHALEWARGGWCYDGPVGTPASQSCSVTRENQIRAEWGFPLRTRY